MFSALLRGLFESFQKLFTIEKRAYSPSPEYRTITTVARVDTLSDKGRESY